MYAKNQEANLGIPFDPKHTKRRKEFSVLHLNQTIQTRKIEKKHIVSWEKQGRQSLTCI